MKNKIEILDDLINDHQKELVKAEFLLDFHENQLKNPTVEGKPAAVEGINVCKETIKRFKRTVDQYVNYKERVVNNAKQNG